MTRDKTRPDDLKASLKSMERIEDDLELIVRLSNTSARALQYIADVRTTKYDPDTKILTLSLSDEGREVILGTIQKLPVFRYIDPGSEAKIRLRVPNRVIKLVRSTPPGKVAFETHHLSEVEEIVINVAWADVPYYKDTRKKDDKRLLAARWQLHKARASKRFGVNRGSTGKG